MPGPDKAAIVAREWIAKAENDLKTAAHTLKLVPSSKRKTLRKTHWVHLWGAARLGLRNTHEKRQSQR